MICSRNEMKTSLHWGGRIKYRKIRYRDWITIKKWWMSNMRSTNNWLGSRRLRYSIWRRESGRWKCKCRCNHGFKTRRMCFFSSHQKQMKVSSRSNLAHSHPGSSINRMRLTLSWLLPKSLIKIQHMGFWQRNWKNSNCKKHNEKFGNRSELLISITKFQAG